MTALYKKELKILSCSLTGYVFSAVFLLSFGGFFVIYNVINAQNSFASAISVVTLPMLVLIPILTMRSFAEERHQKSDQLLYSLPVDMWQVALSKFFSMVTWMFIPYIIICLYPLGLSTLGEINIISTYGMLAAFFILLCCILSIGMFISALTDNQMVAAALSFFFFLVLYVLPLLSSGISTSGLASLVLFTIFFLFIATGIWALCRNIPFSLIIFFFLEASVMIFYLKDIRYLSGKFAKMLDAVSIFHYFGAFTGGIFDIGAIVLYLSVTVVFLFFTVQVLEKRRWNG